MTRGCGYLSTAERLFVCKIFLAGTRPVFKVDHANFLFDHIVSFQISHLAIIFIIDYGGYLLKAALVFEFAPDPLDQLLVLISYPFTVFVGKLELFETLQTRSWLFLINNLLELVKVGCLDP